MQRSKVLLVFPAPIKMKVFALQMQKNMNCKTRDKFNNALITGDLYTVQKMVYHGYEIIDDTKALRLAISSGNLDLVKYLASIGTDMFIYYNDPVYTALDLNKAKIASYLISIGADPVPGIDYFESALIWGVCF